MQGFILDSSSNKSFLVLSQDGRCIANVRLSGGEKLSKSLGQDLQNLLQQYPEFHADFVAVGRGPGSYTGVRVGVALAKALAYGWKVPLVGFNSLEALAPTQDGPFAILSDARIGGIYCQSGRREGQKIIFEEPQLLGVNQIATLSGRLVSSDPDPILRRAPKLEIFPAEPDFDLLSLRCTQKIGQNPTSPFPLSYLSSPAVLEGKP